MKVTIVQSDGIVLIDGRAIEIPELSTMLSDPTVSAVQWYGTEGEIEIGDEKGHVIENQKITSMDVYQAIIDRWNELAAIEDAPPDPPTALQQARIDLAEEGVTNNSVTAALLLQATQSDSTLLDYVDEKITGKATELGVTYTDLTNSIMGIST